MKRQCFLLRVKPDRMAEYRQRHAEVWPEMLDALRRNGWRNYSLFLAEDGLLVGYVETEGNLPDAIAAMHREPINAKWQSEMAPLFEMPASQRPDQSMLTLQEVFHLD